MATTWRPIGALPPDQQRGPLFLASKFLPSEDDRVQAVANRRLIKSHAGTGHTTNSTLPQRKQRVPRR